MTANDSKLSPDIQKDFATLWPIELEDELKRQKEFSKTQKLLSKFAKSAPENHDNGKTQQKGWDEI